MGQVRKSSFLKIYKRKEGFLVFSLLSRRLFLLSSSLDEIFKKLPKNNLLQKQLIFSGLLTKASSYEEEIADYFDRKIKANEEKLLIYFTITSRCDLKCRYCFENHLERSDTKPEEIKLFAELLEKSLENNRKIKGVELTLFGGEPLLRIDLCCLLLSLVKEICLRRNISYKFAMTSNGMIAKKQELRDLKNRGLTDIQITFDGWKNSHDKIRKVEGKGYKDLLRNISWLGKSFNLILKYNIRKQNVNDFTNFVEDIKSLKLKNVIIKLEALQSTLTDSDDSFYFSPQDSKLAETYFDLAKIVIANSLKVDISSAMKPPCMVSAANSFMIEPDGDISACVSAYKVSSLCLGNIRKMKTSLLSFSDREKRTKIKENILKAAKKKCVLEKCPYFPICETGCMFVKETLKINSDLPYCRKRYFNNLIPKLIELKTILDNHEEGL